MEDAIHVLRGALSAGPLGYDSDFHDVGPDVTVTPTPDQEVPIVLAGSAVPAVERAGRLADGWLGLPDETVDDVETRVAHIDRAREEAGIDREFTVYPGARGFVGESREDAWETMKDGYFYMLQKYASFGLPGLEPFRTAESIEDLPEDAREGMRERAVFGSPDDVVEELLEYRHAVGDDAHFVFRTFLPGIDPADLKRCLRRLGRDVAPHL